MTTRDHQLHSGEDATSANDGSSCSGARVDSGERDEASAVAAAAASSRLSSLLGQG